MKYTSLNNDETYHDRRRNLRRNMMENGLQNMSTLEVVELILYYTIQRKDVRPIAKALVERFGTIDRMAKASSQERRSIPGIGERTDEHFAMIGMFIPHVLRNRLGDFPVFNHLNKLKQFCASLHVMHEYEVLYVLCLNEGNRLIKKEVKITVGTPKYVNVELKHILDAVANTSTVKLVLCHNHPSGILEASDDDIRFTKSVQKILENINITLLDHIIIADNSALSMREKNLIK